MGRACPGMTLNSRGLFNPLMGGHVGAEMPNNTIYALASGRPPAAIAIVRVSGPCAHHAARQLAGRLPRVRQASLRTFRDADGTLIDQGLLLRFDGPASSTGEDLAEFHIHGGRAVADAMLGALGGLEGLRLAEPGEFTRRAFENGRIDLTEAEGLADLIEAETESQRKAALMLAEGGLRRQIEQWQDQLLALSARAEVAIDYVGEDDVMIDPPLGSDCAALAAELLGWLERPRVEPLKDGIRVVIAGPPNSGKSSLINALAGTERVIVTPIPGTTRDHIEVPLAIEGTPLLLTDTAGLRDSEDPVERIGIERAAAIARAADVLLWLGAPEEAPDHPRRIMVHSRCDLPERQQAPAGSTRVSAVTAEGLPRLMKIVAEQARQLLPAEDAIALNRRQAAQLGDACTALEVAVGEQDPVLQAEQLRSARAAFDRLTGRSGMEDVLDALFGRFCLGK